MADQDKYNDEYHFSDLEGLNPAGDDETEVTHTETITERKFNEPSNIRRNALIVIGLILLAMILYKFLGSYFSQRQLAVKDPASIPVQPQPQTSTTSTTTTSTPSQVPQAPSVVVQNPASPLDSPQLDQKISSLEVGQQSMRSEVESMNSQLGGINSNLSNLSNQINQLHLIITSLSAKLDAQSKVIEHLTIVKKPAPVIKKVVRKVVRTPRYFIQAVIPGRAWLIAPNGSTLTVREGTALPGYGTVTLIDPNQGKITTSSGQIIRFSQDDS